MELKKSAMTDEKYVSCGGGGAVSGNCACVGDMAMFKDDIFEVMDD
ncbi:MAG: hypothetical protein VZR73_07195 [Acutalibacteraceae bacterium]|nr:hypothetical protein [Acutalibacteraceae bacterium]